MAPLLHRPTEPVIGLEIPTTSSEARPARLPTAVATPQEALDPAAVTLPPEPTTNASTVRRLDVRPAVSTGLPPKATEVPTPNVGRAVLAVPTASQAS